MKRKIITILIVILVFIAIGTLLLQSNQYTALRTRLFIEGHAKLAFTTSIDEIKSDLAIENTKFYIFNPQPKDRLTGNSKLLYKVEKVGNFYRATYHGGG